MSNLKRNFDIITPLDLCVDLMVNMGDIDPRFGQVEQIVNDYLLELGGSACIFATQAVKLGAKVAGIGKIGSDVLGDFVLKRLNENNVDTSMVYKDNQIKTGLGIALTKYNDRAILTYGGSIEALKYEDIVLSKILDTSHFHISSYFLMKNMQSAYPIILKQLKKSGVTVSLDTNWDAEENWDSKLMDIIKYIDIFLPNQQELLAITKKDNETEAINLLKNKVELIIVKKGKKGASAYFRGKRYDCSAKNVKVIDTVGAGDNFNAGFVMGYLNNFDINKCLELGCLTGSMSTTAAGGLLGQINKTQAQKHFKE